MMTRKLKCGAYDAGDKVSLPRGMATVCGEGVTIVFIKGNPEHRLMSLSHEHYGVDGDGAINGKQ